jgi:hypothetical protein
LEAGVKALLVAGTLILTYGMLLGLPMAAARAKAPAAPRHLVTTHLEALISGGVLLALSAAVAFSSLPERLDFVAAILITGGVASTVAGGTLNWRMETGDTFAERSPGFLLQAVGGPVMLLGAVVVCVGVLKAL